MEHISKSLWLKSVFFQILSFIVRLIVSLLILHHFGSGKLGIFDFEILCVYIWVSFIIKRNKKWVEGESKLGLLRKFGFSHFSNKKRRKTTQQKEMSKFV